MVRRVLLDANELKISEPGVNVMTAAPGQLWFSSDRKALQEYSNGQVSFSRSSWDYWYTDGDGRDHRELVANYNYPKGYPAIPLMQFSIDSLFGASWQRGHYRPGTLGPMTLELGNLSGPDEYMRILVYQEATRWRVLGSYAGGWGPAFTVHYRILEHTE